MFNWTKAAPWLVLAIILTAATGCGTNRNDASQSGTTQETSAQSGVSSDTTTEVKTDHIISFTDAEQRTITLKMKPERMVVMSPDVLNMIYALGGTVTARADATGIPLPKGAEQAESVGNVAEVSSEKIVALKPELVIGQPRFHKNLASILDSSNIPFAMLRVTSYEQISGMVELVGKLIGKEQVAKQAVADLASRVDAVRAKLPNKQLTFANMNVTPTSVSIQRTGTIGLDIAKSLNMTNIAERMDADTKSPTTVPYSLEKLVEQDPDFIFLIIHGSKKTGEKKIKSEIESNPAWNSLTAVKQKQVIIVPSALFLTNPGLKYDESLMYLARHVYPDIFTAPVAVTTSSSDGVVHNG